jgi:hypothetical protein
LGVHGNNQVRPCSSHVFSTGSKGTTAMQKPGNNAKDFRVKPGGAKNTQLRAERAALGLQIADSTIHPSCMHVTLTTRPWDVHMATKLGKSLNTPCSGMGSTMAEQ